MIKYFVLPNIFITIVEAKITTHEKRIHLYHRSSQFSLVSKYFYEVVVIGNTNILNVKVTLVKMKIIFRWFINQTIMNKVFDKYFKIAQFIVVIFNFVRELQFVA